MSGCVSKEILQHDLAALLEVNGALSEAMEQLRQAAYLGDESAVEELERLDKLMFREK